MDTETEDRLALLEAKFDRIEALLTRLEPKITELVFTTAKAADLQKVQLDLATLAATTAKAVDLHKAQVDLAEVKGRVSSLPTWWMLMVTVLSTWTVGAGIVFTLVKAARP